MYQPNEFEQFLFNFICRVEEENQWKKHHVDSVWNMSKSQAKVISYVLYMLIKRDIIKGTNLERITEVMEMANVDWMQFESKFIRLEEQEPVELELTEWKSAEKVFDGEKKLMLECKVTKENGKPVDKVLSASPRLARELATHMKKAEEVKVNTVNLRITKAGQGKNIRYIVKAI